MGINVNNQDADTIRVSELLKIVWRSRLHVIISTALVTIASIVILLLLPNVYQARSLLSPTGDNSGGALASLAAQYGGLASLAGLSFGTQSGNQTTVGIELLKSHKFISEFIERHDLLVTLFAAESWDHESGLLSYDDDIYDQQNKLWVREVSPPKRPKPSVEESVRKFKEIFRVRQDGDTGFITVSIEHVSPTIAQHWVELLIHDINNEMKKRDVTQATQSIEYLQSQIEQTSLAEVRAVFYGLIQEQVKKVMLANATDEYFLQTIDPPFVPEDPVRPKRGILIVVIFLISAILSSIAVVFRSFAFSDSADQKI